MKYQANIEVAFALNSFGRPKFAVVCAMKLILVVLLLKSVIMPGFADVEGSVVAKSFRMHGWEGLRRTLETDKVVTSESVRMLLGHCFLALNESNRSLEMFVSCNSERARLKWATWAELFMKSNPTLSVAYYFDGDSKARLGLWREALKSLERAIELDEMNYMAHNALGVVQHGLGKTFLIRKNFNRALAINPSFADAQANLGVVGVFQYSTKTMDSFIDAIELSKDKVPVLYQNGLACTSYGAGQRRNAIEFFEAAMDASNIVQIPALNILALKAEDLRFRVDRARDLGTSIRAMSFDDRGVGGDPDEFDPDDIPVEVIVQEDGTIVIELKSGRFIVIPPAEDDEDDEDDRGNPGSDPDDGVPVGGVGIGGLVAAHSRVDLWIPSDQEMASIDVGLQRLSALLDGIETRARNNSSIGTNTNRERSGLGKFKGGGADSDSSDVSVNRGNWPVRTVYGLLYDIQSK